MLSPWAQKQFPTGIICSNEVSCQKIAHMLLLIPDNHFNSQSFTKLMKQLSFLLTVILILQTVSCADIASDLTEAQKWIYGVLTGFAVSILGFVAAIFLVGIKKCISENAFKITMNFLYALGCGALLGDAIVHILPDSFSNPAVNSQIVSLTLILAIVFFLLLERGFVALGITHQHWGEDDCQHQHSHEPKKVPENSQDLIKQDSLVSNQVENTPSLASPIKPTKDKASPEQVASENLIKTLVPKVSTANQIALDLNGTPIQEEQKSCLENLKGKGSTGYLNLMSSFIHNFMDGLGIGVGFATGSSTVYVPIVIAIFVHEIPREMADVAILLKSGFSGVQTILCNGFINTLSLVGVIIGLAVGNISEDINAYILIIVAGNFLYISADIWRHLFKNTDKCRNVQEFIGLAIGVGAMFCVLLAESK